jgi:hypothetical protein
MPKKPNDRFQICQKRSSGFVIALPIASAIIPNCCPALCSPMCRRLTLHRADLSLQCQRVSAV